MSEQAQTPSSGQFPEQAFADAFEAIRTRRSVKAVEMQGPGPDAETVDRIIEAAIRVPDHGKLGPWRFIRFVGDARAEFGEVLASRFKTLNPDAEASLVEAERGRFTRATTVVAVIARVRPGIKIPEWEQQLSAGAACQNMLVAATLLGYASQWLTEWYAYDEEIDRALGLSEDERVAGYVYLGSAVDRPPERPRPKFDAVVSNYGE